MLKIKKDIDLKILEDKFGFKRVQQNKKNNYIYRAEEFTNHIMVYEDENIYSLGYHRDEDRRIFLRFNEQSFAFDTVMDKLYELINAGIIEKVRRE